MGYRTVVLVKQVPDTANVSGEVMRPNGTVNRSKLPAIFNPDDRVALELALRVRDQYGGQVTALTMGPPKASELLRECLYMGADDVCLVTDRRFAGADTLATSYVLSAAIRKLGAFDLIFAGRQAIDGDTAQVGPQTAEKLGVPQVTSTEVVLELAEGKARLKHRIDGGYEVVESALPLLLTVVKDAADPRPFLAKRLMACKDARTRVELERQAVAAGGDLEGLVADYARRGLYMQTLSADDLDVELERCGLDGSPTKVHKVLSVVLSAEGHEDIAPTREGVSALLDCLLTDRVLG